MSWDVRITKKAGKKVRDLPKVAKAKLETLVREIEVGGPVRGDWANYSKLADGSHHCHLTYRYVACWRETEKGIEVEVYYVGTREGAPY